MRHYEIKNCKLLKAGGAIKYFIELVQNLLSSQMSFQMKIWFLFSTFCTYPALFDHPLEDWAN